MYHKTLAYSLGFTDSARGRESYVHLFTKDYGKIVVRVAGMQKLLSKKRMYLQGNYLLEIELYGKENAAMMTLSDLHPKESILDYDVHPEYINDVFFLLAFLKRILPEGEQEQEVFTLCQKTLSQIISCSPLVLSIWLLSNVLRVLGFISFNNTCMECNNAFGEKVFVVEGQWQFLCGDCADTTRDLPLQHDEVKYLMVSQRLSLDDFKKITLSDESRKKLLRILSTVSTV